MSVLTPARFIPIFGPFRLILQVGCLSGGEETEKEKKNLKIRKAKLVTFSLDELYMLASRAAAYTPSPTEIQGD